MSVELESCLNSKMVYRKLTSRTMRLLLVILLLTTSYLFLYSPIGVYAQSSRIYVDPVASNLPVGSTLTIYVKVDLGSGDAINAFDVKLNYTDGYTRGVLDASSISFESSIFSGRQTRMVAACVDSFPQVGEGCTDLDGTRGGVVHGAQALIGETVSGPFNGVLFKIDFEVKGIGTSTFDIFQDVLASGQSSVPHNTDTGVFGNDTPVAFFNFSPSITVTGLPIAFDGLPSFDPKNPSGGIASYEWEFGDGTGPNPGPARLIHVFADQGNFIVKLTVSSSTGSQGSMSRRLSVVLPLGSLQLSVQDPAKGPVAGALVEVIDQVTGKVLVSSTTGRNGVVRFDNLAAEPVNNYRVRVSGTNVETAEDDFTVVAGQITDEPFFVRTIRGFSVDPLLLLLGGTAGFVGGIFGLVFYTRRRREKGAGKRKLERKRRVT